MRDHEVDLVVLSNWDARLHNVLDGLGLGEYFSQRFISAELGWEKPDPAIYRHVAEILRIAPGQLLSVGDDPQQRCGRPEEGWLADGAGRAAEEGSLGGAPGDFEKRNSLPRFPIFDGIFGINGMREEVTKAF